MKALMRIAVVCVLIAGAVYGCSVVFFPTYHVRFRLTVEVKDSGQTKTGSSVLEVAYPIVPDGLHSGLGSSSSRYVVGYAPTVSINPKHLLFLTFANVPRKSPEQIAEYNKRIFCQLDDFPCLPFVAYAKPGSLPVTTLPSQQKEALEELLRQSGPQDVPLFALPRLVTFTDIDDYKTKTVVSPSDLAATFASGVELSRVILELTRDPITPEPQIWPQWMQPDKNSDGEFRGH